MFPIITGQQLLFLVDKCSWTFNAKDEMEPFDCIEMNEKIPGLGYLRIFENGNIETEGNYRWKSDESTKFVVDLFLYVLKKINHSRVKDKEKKLNDFIKQFELEDDLKRY